MNELALPVPPILRAKAYQRPSVFAPESLLREARRQKAMAEGTVPSVCVLDPDGDIVRSLVASGQGTRNLYWACYHTEMIDVKLEGLHLGLIGCAVGASFATL